MAYDTKLAERIREHLFQLPALSIEEKIMFRGLAFMVNGKMCVNVSGQNMMCRFDPALTKELAERSGVLPMVMKGKVLKGFCYVEPTGLKRTKDFVFWINVCLAFNDSATSSKNK